jgi:hypothetical protein
VSFSLHCKQGARQLLFIFSQANCSKKLLPEITNILIKRQYVFQEIILKIFAVVMLKARKFSKVSRTAD